MFCSSIKRFTGHPDHPLTMVPASPAIDRSLGATIGIIILAALLAAVLVLFFCYRRCQKEKEKRHVSVAYTTGTGSSEYVVPGELGLEDVWEQVKRGGGQHPLEGRPGSANLCARVACTLLTQMQITGSFQAG